MGGGLMMTEQEDNRTIQEIMKDLERACLEFQTKWQAFEADYKSKYKGEDNDRR